MAYSEKEVEELFNEACERMEKGESVRAILKDEHMPSSRTFFKWIDKDDLKVKQYARACDLRADHMFDEMFDIADNSSNDYMDKLQGDEVIKVPNTENIQRSRLRIDTRKWALSKMNPKKYSEKMELKGDITINPFLSLMQQTTANDNTEPQE